MYFRERNMSQTCDLREGAFRWELTGHITCMVNMIKLKRCKPVNQQACAFVPFSDRHEWTHLLLIFSLFLLNV